MAIMRWSPNFSSPRDPIGLQDEVNRLFDSFFTRLPQRGDHNVGFTPSIDIQESPEEFIVRADLPGVAQKDVRVSLMGDVLTIRGERRQENGDDQGSMHRVERLHGSFERSFSLGVPVRNDQVKATFRDGVLEVRVPKAEEARLKEIEVKVG
jgi:HSP20 family protein